MVSFHTVETRIYYISCCTWDLSVETRILYYISCCTWDLSVETRIYYISCCTWDQTMKHSYDINPPAVTEFYEFELDG